MKRVYRIAGLTVGIVSIYDDVHRLCRGYLADDQEAGTDFTVETSPEDLDYERLRAEGDYSDGYFEILAVYRKIAERTPEYDTVLFHGSAVSVDKSAYIFTAASGTGKSTHAGLWRRMLGDRAVMVNDDKPLIKITESGSVVFGTPWDGKHRLSSNIAVPVKAIAVLERAESNSIAEITKREAMPMLLQQTYRPAGIAALARTLELIDRLDMRFYRLRCNMDVSAAEMSYNKMKE